MPCCYKASISSEISSNPPQRSGGVTQEGKAETVGKSLSGAEVLPAHPAIVPAMHRWIVPELVCSFAPTCSYIRIRFTPAPPQIAVTRRSGLEDSGSSELERRWPRLATLISPSYGDPSNFSDQVDPSERCRRRAPLHGPLIRGRRLVRHRRRLQVRGRSRKVRPRFRRRDSVRVVRPVGPQAGNSHPADRGIHRVAVGW